jgi:hypothetical protein
MTARIEAVSRDDAHRFSKVPQEAIRLIAGVGVEGDAIALSLPAEPHRKLEAA